MDRRGVTKKRKKESYHCCFLSLRRISPRKKERNKLEETHKVEQFGVHYE